MSESATIAEVVSALRSRAASQVTMLPLYWRDDGVVLPDEPTPFVFFELIARRGRIAAFGAGRGNNVYRTPAELAGYVFVPRGWGLTTALTHAEAVAAAFRSWREGAVSCFDATVYPIGEGEALAPPGMSSAVNNYACAVVSVSLTFDQVG